MGTLSQRPVINRLPISDMSSGRADCWALCITLEASSYYCSGSAGASILLGDCMCTTPVETTQTRNPFLHHCFCDAFIVGILGCRGVTYIRTPSDRGRTPSYLRHPPVITWQYRIHNTFAFMSGTGRPFHTTSSIF
jgi:hypothetical protein